MMTILHKTRPVLLAFCKSRASQNGIWCFFVVVNINNLMNEKSTNTDVRGHDADVVLY